jgi:uncharacterized protein YprB with RNaseH-like and TPR domain
MTGLPLGGVAARLRETIDRNREYSVVENDNLFRASFVDRHVFSSEYGRARALLAELLAAYDGVPLDEAIRGEWLDGPLGESWVVVSSEPAPGPAPSPETAMRLLRRDLRLVHGIGPALESRLARRGYAAIDDLVWHRRLAPAARWALDALDSGDPVRIAGVCAGRRGRSHPDYFLAAELHDEADHVYFDLETLGLFSRPVILFGIARLRDRRVEVEQHLVRDPAHERGALAAALDALGSAELLVSFNGRSFDLPYLAERAAYYGIDHAVPSHHLDLLPIARKLWRDRLPDCRLCTVEAGVLGRERTDDLPSAMVPEFYTAYHRTGNPGPLLPILAHNRDDLVSMVRLVARLREVCHAG